MQAVIQTRDGYLWLGSQEGLVRFDGARFAVFNKKNTPQILHNDTRALFEGRDGTLWAGMANGLICYKDGQFSSFLQKESGAVMISNLCEDHQGNIWMGILGGGVKRLTNGQFTSYTAANGLLSDVVNAIYADSQDTIWVGTSNGINRIYQNGKIDNFSRGIKLPSNYILAIRETRDGSFWIGTREGLVQIKNGQTRTYTTQDGLSGNTVTTLYEDHDSYLWIGTEGKGVNRLADGKFSNYTMKDGLSDDYIMSICQDREGILWIGTYNGGLNRLWEGKFVTFTVRDRLPTNEVRTVMETRDGSMWVGTRGGGLVRLQGDKLTIYNTRDGLGDNTIRALYEDRDGVLWIGTNNGFSAFRDGRFTNYTRKDGLAHDFVRSITQDHDGRLWIGTYGGGLHLFQNGKIINYRDKGIPFNVIRTLAVGHDGSLWVGSNDGLTQLKDGRVTHYTARDGLPLNPVYVVYEDADHVLWVGTYGGGLCRFKDGRFAQFNITNGLFDDVVFQVLEDQQGDFWMSCNVGIFRASKQVLNDFADGKIKNILSTSYGMADGMRSNECNGNSQPCGWRARDGRLWFPTIEGLVVIDPAHIEQNRLPPLVSLEQVIIDRKSYNVRQTARASPGTGSLEFRFAGLSFIAPERVKFKYRLEGFDPEWVEAGTRREAFYTNIPPGEYKFKVIACNNDGLWNTTGASFSFYLQPFFYQTKTFYALVALAIFLSGFAVNRLRIKKLKVRERELATLVAERTKDLADANHKLEAANKELERLANVDGLTGVSNRRNFMNIFDVEWRRTERHTQPLSLIMADVDHFKAYNDNHGHQAGDQCLKLIAAMMRETVTRAGDVIGRYGGEEFIILLPVTDLNGASMVAERLRKKIESVKIKHGFSDVSDYVTISLGVATVYPSRSMTKEILIKASDVLLYQAKKEGRNRWKAQFLAEGESKNSHG